MASLLVVLFGLVFFVACVFSGLWNLGAAVHRSGRERRRILARAAAKLTTAALVAAIPWVAVPFAESSTGWIDTDHDGMLDGFVNGSYDWVDINGGAWATAAAVLVIIVLVCLVAVLVALRSSEIEGYQTSHPVGVSD